MFAIGSSLKEARLRKGLDLAAAADATKIRSRHLQALEDEHFDVLPGQTYVRGFLKTYADFLDLDGQLYVDEYSSRFWVNEDGSPATRRKVRIRRKHHRRIELNMVILTVVAIAGVTTLVIAAWKFGGADTTPPARPVPPAAAAPRTVTHQPVARLTVKAVKGSSLIDVRVLEEPRPGRTAPLPRHARARQVPDLRRQVSLGGRQLPEARRALAERRHAARAQRPLPAVGRGHSAADHVHGRLPLTGAPAPERPRAAIVVTGSELVRGERTDLNGPFLARELLSLGVEPTRIAIVGDTPGELAAALGEGLQADLCVVSGGLGPTHDDRTVELLAAAAGLDLVVDEKVEREIEARSRAVAERLKRPYTDFAAGVTKQATRPETAVPVGLVGTAPALVVPLGDRVAVVLPGPPWELKQLWPRALESEPVRALLARAHRPSRRVLRFYGASESAIAQALAAAGGDGDGVEATICARDFEIHVDFVVAPGADERADELARALVEPLDRYLFAEDEQSVEEIVLELCRARELTLATAESCTGGLVAARLTSVPGSSDVFLGAVVAYANDVKEAELGVSEELLQAHGAVSAETAAAMAAGVRERLGADVGIAVTGIAGPGGGSEEKPVGLVYMHVETPDASRGLEFSYPADRESIRRRATVAGLHLARRVLSQSRDTHV